MKVLHINYALERGGIETWLLRLVKQFDPNKIRISLAYHRSGSASMAADLQDAGVKLLKLPSPRSPLSYLKAYRQLLRTAGPFDAVHSNLNFAGLLMLGAKLEKVPVRLAHSHVSAGLMTRGLIAGSYTRLTNRLFLPLMTHAIGVSPSAAQALFGNTWTDNPKILLEPCGIDLSPFTSSSPSGLREALGIPADALVLGMIGRLSEEKNQTFALQLVAELARNNHNPHLLLAGEGPSRQALEQLAQQLDISDQIHFLNERKDVPALLKHDINLLLMPSTTEGAPLAIIEAQAAGIPSLVSNAIPDQSILIPELVTRMPLSQGVTAWANEISSVVRPPMADTRDKVENTPFDIQHNAQLLASIYNQQTPHGLPAATHSKT